MSAPEAKVKLAIKTSQVEQLRNLGMPSNCSSDTLRIRSEVELAIFDRRTEQ